MTNPPLPEFWDLLGADRESLGETHARGFPVPRGKYHLVVEIWVIDSAGRILLTRRHPDKPFGLFWEGTGGSALAHRYTGEDTHYDVWLFRKDPAPKEIRLQAEEVVDAKWVDRAEFAAMLERGEIIPKLRYLLDVVLPRLDHSR